MAKLSARGRTEYVRARHGDQLVAFMSDGVVLYQRRDPLTGRAEKWRVQGRWDRVRVSLPVLRAHVVAKGWEIVKGDGVRSGSLAAVASGIAPW